MVLILNIDIAFSPWLLHGLVSLTDFFFTLTDHLGTHSHFHYFHQWIIQKPALNYLGSIYLLDLLKMSASQAITILNGWQYISVSALSQIEYQWYNYLILSYQIK